ncbi:hypothetical protein pqer_cds_1126 [Pandoravirus quercus]|uniref:Microbial-type PARG catalytic domain-containing protein n=1 Tax=Pandoravirus quercus TaxID=2107709 RepID=A0A2U7UAS1_9VIRU|nr:hypothetical protein pqer_cds_1126 [Pandoravirus quercus]AVK75548.1 hypothetical protein pqer_cds_1126 [Pandoravirus quercus]
MDRATRASDHTPDNRPGFDAAGWLAAHKQALARGDKDLARGLRIDVAIDTIDCATRGAYVLRDGTRVDLATEREVRDQVCATALYRPKDVRRAAATATLYDVPATCEVVRGDCLKAAIALKTERGLNPAVLNMASSRRPGGGYKTGAAAQEENIFRRSNYFLSLEDPRRIDRQRQWRYPLHGLCGIYSPSVSVFRGPEDEGYPFLDRPVRLDFIAVPAIVRPQVHVLRDGAQRLGQADADLMRQKIALMLDIALAHKHDSVVLGAFGCGAFGNPPDHVALLFREVLLTDAYRCHFRHICFAIFDDHNARKAHNPRGNVAPFCDVFATPLDAGRTTEAASVAVADPDDDNSDDVGVGSRHNRGARPNQKSAKGRRNGRVRPGRPYDGNTG